MKCPDCAVEMKSIYVLAGNYEQFKAHERELRSQYMNIHYLDSFEQTHGLLDFEIIRIGTWWENPISYEIERAELLSARPK